MESNDVSVKLTRAKTIAERLSALVTPKRPLTVNEILMMSICIMLPASFKPTVTPLLQQDSVTASQVISAVRKDLIVNDIKPVVETVASAVDKRKDTDRRRDDNCRRDAYCHYCRKSGHTKQNCTRIKRKNKERDEFDKMKTELAEIKASMSKSKPSQTEKASVANQIPRSPQPSNDESSVGQESDFSYSVNHTLSIFGNSSDQVVDSGCSIHMVPSSTHVTDVSHDHTNVKLADGSIITSIGKGKLDPGFNDGTTQTAVVVPKLTEPLLSVSKLSDEGVTTVFDKNNFCFYHNQLISGNLIGQGVRRGGLYYLPKLRTLSTHCKRADKTEEDILLMWHRQLNHPCIQTLKKKLKMAGLDVLGSSAKGVRGCKVCLQGKMRRRALHSRFSYKAQKLFSTIHSDVSEYPTVGRDGSKFFVTFIDDYSKVVRSFPIRHKSDTLECFKKFKTEVEALSDVKIAELRSDNGGEYVGDDFKSFCASYGILQTMGPPNTPQLNGVSERWNRTIKEKIRCSLIESNLPDSFWPYALSYCTETYNHLPTRTNLSFQSPLSLSGLPERDVNDLHPFGCEVWYHVTTTSSKLAPRSRPGVFLCYLKNNKGIYLHDQSSGRLVKSTKNHFYDSSFPGSGKQLETPAPPRVQISWPLLPTSRSELSSDFFFFLV